MTYPPRRAFLPHSPRMLVRQVIVVDGFESAQHFCWSAALVEKADAVQNQKADAERADGEGGDAARTTHAI